MKTLTIREPWATLIIEGMKEYEFRSWKTNYRGRVLIHAGKGFDKDCATLFQEYDFTYGKGEIIGEAELVDCIYIDSEFDEKLKAMNSLVYGKKNRIGKYAWKFEKVKRYEDRYLVKGQLGLWDYEFDKKIKLSHGSYLCYDEGGFDSWCVYEVYSNGDRKAPRDIDVFLVLNDLANKFGRDDIYAQFIKIYEVTTRKFDVSVVELIREIALKYQEYCDELFRVLAILYMTMIAEENKKNTKLGKRIKRLGVYYLLVFGKSPDYCVSFMEGYSWKRIDELCLEGGF